MSTLVGVQGWFVELVFVLFVCEAFVLLFVFVFGFWFCYVKEVWPEAPSDEQLVTRAECFRKRRGTGWQPAQCSCSQSH